MIGVIQSFARIKCVVWFCWGGVNTRSGCINPRPPHKPCDVYKTSSLISVTETTVQRSSQKWEREREKKKSPNNEMNSDCTLGYEITEVEQTDELASGGWTRSSQHKLQIRSLFDRVTSDYDRGTNCFGSYVWIKLQDSDLNVCNDICLYKCELDSLVFCLKPCMRIYT